MPEACNRKWRTLQSVPLGRLPPGAHCGDTLVLQCTLPVWKVTPYAVWLMRHFGPLLIETAETIKEYPAPRPPITANIVEVNI